MTAIRICFVGDSVTAGTGDVQCLGWPGRLSATGNTAYGHDVSCYNLGIRADTSRDIKARWLQECQPRLPDHSKAGLTFMFGLNDVADQSGTQRIETAESLQNARDILGTAKSRWPVLWLGPTPVREDEPEIRPGEQISYRFYMDRVASLNDHFRELARELDIPYFDSLKALANTPEWQDTLAAGDGIHPTASGYRYLATCLENWQPWRDWFDS